jgi:hypothetical protein
LNFFIQPKLVNLQTGIKGGNLMAYDELAPAQWKSSMAPFQAQAPKW